MSTARTRVAAHARGALWLMTASGFAGLGYQIVWTLQVAPWVGHEAAAVLAVITAFFGGLAVGAFACGAAVERSRRPVLWYAACETVIGLWALVLLLAMPTFGTSVLQAIGADATPVRQWVVVFGATFVVLLPATAAMGATLPAFERALRGSSWTGRSIATAYACNTLGAVIGVLGTTFWLIPAVGLAWTATVCVVVNLSCAVLALRVLPSHAAVAAPRLENVKSPPLLVRLWITGLLGIGYEVLVVRVLSQVNEDTVYTFALLLAVYLAGTTCGAAFHRRRLQDVHTPRLVERLTLLLAAACLAGTGTLWFSAALRMWLIDLLPTSVYAALAAEALLAVAAFALPTVVMGMLFAALCDHAATAGSSIGRAVAANTFGAACGPCLFGVVLVPACGPKTALLIVVAGYLAMTVTPGSLRGGRWTGLATATVVAALIIVGLTAPPLAFVDVPDGGRVVHYEDGVTASVSVVEDADGVHRLRIDDRQQEGTSATAYVDGRQALLPLLLHPHARHALFLGLGTGVTARVAADTPGLDVDAVELLPEVIAASPYFAPPGPAVTSSSRLHVVAADARRYVRARGRRYDVIVADNFQPARSGSGALYTVEHFRAIRARLEGDGLFCQWLPLHQLDFATLRSIVVSFIDVYPKGFAILANNSLDTPVIGLVATADARAIDFREVRDALASHADGRLPSFGIDDAFSVVGSIVAGPASLARFADGAPLNRDDRPVVAYLAPRATYAPETSSRSRLLAWLRVNDVAKGEVVDTASEPDIAMRVAAYRVARNDFIAAGAQVRPTTDVAEMVAQVRAPLLRVLEMSPDFRPAYDPLLRMAVALRARSPKASDALLEDLVRLQPSRPEARSLLTAR